MTSTAWLPRARGFLKESYQLAVFLSVISYLLFGRSVTKVCLDDLNDFYDFYAFYDFYDFNDLLFSAYRSPLTKGYAFSPRRSS